MKFLDRTGFRHVALTTFCIFMMSMGYQHAQVATPKQQIRPGQLFLSGYTAIEDAQKFEKIKLYKHAWNKYHQALRNYKSISHNFPEWKPGIVNMRIKDTLEEIKRVEPLAQLEHAKKQELLKNYERKNTSENGIPNPERANKKLATNHNAAARVALAPEEKRRMNKLVDEIKLQRQRIAKLEMQRKMDREKHRRQIASYSDKLRRAQQGLSGAADNKQTRILNEQIAILQRRLAKSENHSKEQLKKLFALHNRLTRKRDELASAPLKKDVEKLEQEKLRYEAEIEQIVGMHKKHLVEFKKLSKAKYKADSDLKLAHSALAAKSKQLEASKNASHKIVASLRKTIKEQQQHITSLERQVVALNSENDELKGKLAATNGINQDLTNELAAVTLERDKLTQLLNLSDTERAKRTIKEALRLGELVRKHEATIKQLITDKNDAQDEILAEKSKLAVAKKQILDLQDDNIDYIKRIAALEKSLQNTNQKLSKSLTDPKADPLEREEAVALKKALKNLTIKLERKKQAEALLWKEYQKSGLQGTQVGFSIQNLIKDKIDLTKEERKLLRDKQDTDQFRLSGIKPTTPAQRQAAIARTNAQIESLESVALRCVEKGNLHTAKDLYDEAYVEYGHHYPFFINRGVIRYKLDEFEDAAEIFESGTQLKEKNPYTHYMLGLCRYQLQKDDLAQKSLEEAIALKPDYTDAYVYLGTIAFEKGNYREAVQRFEKAVRINPEDSKTLFNLSFVLHKMGHKKRAIKAYNDALKAGLPPVLNYEEQLGIKKKR